MFVDFNILNQLGSPSINSNTFANRPAAGQTGRLFVSTDTFEIYRDNGTGWDLIGGPGAGTITGTGTATQVAYFTGAQTIGSSANLFWDNTAGALGINTATPGAELDVHGTGTIVQVNATGATSNAYLTFQRTGTGVWRIGDTYNGGNNFFELHNTVLTIDALEFEAATNKSTFLGQQTYASGLATGNQFTYNLTVPNGVNITSPNAVGAVNSYLNLSLGGNTTVPVGARQGLEGNSRISFTGAGTLTMTQGSTVRAFSALSSVYSFAGSAVGTVTHLAGLRICFPDNIGSAINITNNYGLLLNDQTTGLGTVTYTNRWGIYQEGASDLNYFNGNLLVGSTTNSGQRLQVTGTALFTGSVTGTGNSSTYTVTAASGVARSKSITSTLVAAANNDVLVGLDINPTFTNGAFTGVTNYAARFQNADVQINGLNFGKGAGNGTSNVAIGTRFSSVYSANNSTGVGVGSLDVTTGGNNAAFGYAALLRNTTGTFNVGIGGVALQNNTTGGTNIALGYNAGSVNTTGSNNIFIGNWTTGVVNSNSNWTYIGNSTTTSTFIAGNLLLNTTTDAGFRLDIAGTARVQGDVTITGNISASRTGANFLATFSSNATQSVLRLSATASTGNFDIVKGSGSSQLTSLNELIVYNAPNHRFDTGPVTVNSSFSASSGTTTFNTIPTNPTFNFTGTYAGIVRGLFYNPTLTSMTGVTHRAIETTTGDVILGSTSGSTGIGATTTINASAILQVTSTTQGFLPPRMTTAQKNAIAAPAAGLTIYDTTLNKLCVFTGVNWETVTSV